MEIKIAHCADLHIGAKNNYQENKFGLESWINRAVFFNILEECEKQKVDFLLVAGDLFDNFKISNFEVNEVKDKLNKSGIKTVIAPGNHDPFTLDSLYADNDWPKNVWIFKNKEISCFEYTELKVRIFGSAFCGIYEDKCLLSVPEIPKDNFLNLGVLHGDILNSGKSFYNPIKISDIEKSHLDYLALGHIHKRSKILKAGNTFYAYSGSPQGRGFNELGEKGIYMGKVSKSNCKLEFKKTCMHIYDKIFIDVSSCHTHSEIISCIINKIESIHGSNYHQNIYQISIEGNLEEDFTIDVNYLKNSLNKYVISADIIDETNVKISLEKLEYKNDFKSIFIRNALKRIEFSKNESERQIKEKALKLGLKAFFEDVNYREI